MRLLAAAATLLVAAPARAADELPRIRVRWAADTAMTAGAVGLAIGVAALPVDTAVRWQREILGDVDEAVKRNFSASAARASDRLAVLSVVAGLGVQLAYGFTAEAGKRSLVFVEAMAVDVALNGLTKWAVARPRPYVYSTDPHVSAWWRRPSRFVHDSHLSFYSGHASTAFGAAIAGSYLYAHATTDLRARTIVWASTLAVAGATANLRVRAGRHFFSDVLVGAIVGGAVGWFIPALHYDAATRRELSTPEWIALGAAPLAGALVGQLVPFTPGLETDLALLPWVGPGGGTGIALGGAL